MPVYRVEVTTTYYDVVTVAAPNEEEARRLARVSQLDHAGGEYSEAEVHGVERIRMDLDEALHDAFG